MTSNGVLMYWEPGDFVRSVSDGLYGYITTVHNRCDLNGWSRRVDVAWIVEDGYKRARDLDELEIHPVDNDEKIVLRIMSC